MKTTVRLILMFREINTASVSLNKKSEKGKPKVSELTEWL